jgi:PAS domain S-box-containing protein
VDSPTGASAQERALERRARHAEALFEGIDDAVFVHDLEGHILDVNPAACRRLGYSRDELLRLTTRDIDDPAFASRFKERLREQLSKGRLSCEGSHRTRDGHVIPVDINTSFIEIDGKPAVLAVIRDITGRKLAEGRLAAQYAVTRVLAEAGTLSAASPQILQAIGEGLDWDLAVLWVVDAQADVLRCVDAWHGTDRPVEQFEALTRASTFERGIGLPGRVWQSGRPAVIADVVLDRNFPRAHAAAAEGLHGAFAFPILGSAGTIGVMEFFSRNFRDADGDLLSMMGALGSQIGQFIDRRRTEEDRLRLAKSVRLLLESSGEGIYGVDVRGRCTFINKSAADMIGYRADEALGKDVHELIHHHRADGSPYPAAECPMCRVGETGQSCRVDTEVLWRRDGSAFPAEYSCQPIVEEGDTLGAVVTFTDITARKRAESEITRANALLDSIVEHIPNMIFVKDAAQLRFERINRAAEELLGYRREDLVGKNDYDFFPREQADFFTEKDREVLRGRELVEIPEEEIDTKVGKRIFHTRKLPIVDERGHPKYLLGISEDITERKALETTRRQYAEARERYAKELEGKNQALGESERRYRQLMEASLNGIVVAEAQGRITLFNPAAERIFGYTTGEVVGQPLLTLLPEEFRDAHARGFARYLETRQPRLLGTSVELRGRRKDGTEFPLELSLSAVDLGGDLQFLGAISDLTERNRMRAMVVQTEKLASIGLLSAGVAHEINNPLAYVANNLVVLERDTKGLMALLEVYERARDRLAGVDAEVARQAVALAEDMDLPYVRDNLDRILSRTREGVQRVSRIVQSLRGLARTDRPLLEDVHLPDLVDSSLEMIRGRLQRRGIKVELDYGKVPKMRCVSTQLSQVLLNLLVNALQAIESTPGQDKGRIGVTVRKAQEELLVEVSDNGCGIEPKEVARIFDPFYTTKPVGEGTGLGLSITHGIVTGHGGRIDVDSRPGEGSRFRVFLPLDPQRGSA